MTRTPMAFLSSRLAAGDFNSVKNLSRSQVAHFEPKQPVDIHKTEFLAAVNREGANHVAERAHGATHLMGLRIENCEHGRFESGQINVLSIEPVNRVVRAGFGYDLLFYVASR